MRHPQTGELFVVPEKQRVKFTPFHSFKSAMNEEKHD
jgi:nucleoid DNA-binding protein